MTWDNIERRKMDNKDHDLLTKIDANLTNFMDEFKDLKTKVNWQEKILYVGIGGIAVIDFVSKFLK